MKKIKLVEIFCYLVFFLISKNRYVFVAFSVFILPLPVTFNLHGQKEIGGGGEISCIKCQVEQNIKKWGVNQEFCTVLYVQLKLTVSDVKSAGSSDILATARVESLPTSALYGASFP